MVDGCSVGIHARKTQSGDCQYEKTRVTMATTRPSSTKDDLTSYRQSLVAAAKDSQSEYDKAVLSLSGGAIGVTFAFVDKIAGDPIAAPSLLMIAWTAWGLSVTAILFSHFFSQLALRTAIGQIDDGSIRRSHAGGKFARFTAFLNAFGGILFLIGVFALAGFAWKNLTGVTDGLKKTEPTLPPTPAAISATTGGGLRATPTSAPAEPDPQHDQTP